MMAMSWDDKAILAKLASLETKDARNAVRKGVRAGRKDTLAEVRANAKSLNSSSGRNMADKIKRSLKLRVTPKSKLHAKDAYAMEINFDTAKSPDLVYKTKEGVRYFIPFAIEYGHVGPGEGVARSKNRKASVVRNFAKRKVAEPIPFMRRAHESTIGKSFSAAKNVIMNELLRAWRK